MVLFPPAVDNSDCPVQDRLNALHLTDWEARKKHVAIVRSGNHEAVDYLDDHVDVRIERRIARTIEVDKTTSSHQPINVGRRTRLK